ncbi:MAG: DUF368 domain-containing protein [Clostridia bacterium]
MLDIIKGIIIGIANVIPGLSGGTIAVAMGIYDKLIHAINNITKTPKECIKSVWKYAVGMGIGIIISVVVIVKMFELFPLPTTMLFVGLILGSLPIITSNLKGKKATILDIGLFLLMIAVIIIMPQLSSGAAKTFALTPVGIAILFAIGVIAAATMIIPGVSGSMMLMVMGYYDTLINLLSDTIKAFFTLDIATCFSNCLIILPFGIGVLVGIAGISKLIEYLLEKHKKTVFWAILGLLIASPYGIIIEMKPVTLTPVVCIISVVTLIIGVFITIKLGDSDDATEDVKKIEEKH